MNSPTQQARSGARAGPQPERRNVGRTSGVGPLSQLLALFLLLLAFFIVLNALSTFDEARTGAVMDSLSRTFSADRSRPSDDFSGLTGSVVAETRAFQDALGDLFETDIPAARVRIVEPGRELWVDMRADALFLPETAEVRPARIATVDALVAILASASNGLAYSIEFLVGTDYDSRQRWPETERVYATEGALDLNRAGAMGRLFLERGADPVSVMVGLRPADAGQIRMVFRAVEQQNGTILP